MPSAEASRSRSIHPQLVAGGVRLIAVLTCFNRKALTLGALAALERAAAFAGVAVDTIVVDDASTDGTSAAIRAQFPSAQVIEGDGSLFWCRGMHRGMQEALRREASHVLWLNDDTRLNQGAVRHLLDQAEMLRLRDGREAIVVGATSDGAGRLTYGGDVSAGGWRRFRYTRVGGESAPVPCDAMNGNCVLIPMTVARAVGNLDPTFEHAMGDTDYALRSAKAGYGVYVAAGFVGVCSVNPVRGSFNDVSLPLRARWRAILHRKGLPWRSWLQLTRRHGGVIWPVYFAWPYLRMTVSALLRRPRT